MSSDSLAMFRKSLGPDLSALAEQHMQHDLQPSDRDALRQAASTVSLHTSIGSAVGVALGTLLAFRMRRARQKLFRAFFRAAEQPRALRFADGREEALPNLAPMLRPSGAGDVATYLLLGAGGLFFGGEAGLLTGSFRARQRINADRDSRVRIERAFRRFQADALRTQANLLDRAPDNEADVSTWKL